MHDVYIFVINFTKYVTTCILLLQREQKKDPSMEGTDTYCTPNRNNYATARSIIQYNTI